MTTAIRLTQLSKRFRAAERPSVNDLHLEVPEGDFLCLLGPSGCGKSTTLRMIAGLEEPTAGRIEVGGRVVDDVAAGRHVVAERRGLGFVFQNYALWPHMSVHDNVAFGPARQGTRRAERDGRVRDALTTLGIAEYADRYPSELSGGQQQRVAIARTLAAAPSVMLLDEPLSNLDARLRLEMRAEFQRLHRETGVTMVFVTHDQWEAMTLATRIAVMEAGRIHQVGTPAEVYDTPVNRFVAEFLGNPPLNVVELAHSDAERRVSTAERALGDGQRRRATAVASAGFRPERLRLDVPDDVPQGGDVVAFEVTVTAVLPTGGSWIVEVSDGERRLLHTSTAPPSHRPGDRVVAWAPAAEVLFFDADGVRLVKGQ